MPFTLIFPQCFFFYFLRVGRNCVAKLTRIEKTKIFVILTFQVLFITKIFVYLGYRNLNNNKN